MQSLPSAMVPVSSDQDRAASVRNSGESSDAVSVTASAADGCDACAKKTSDATSATFHGLLLQQSMWHQRLAEEHERVVDTLQEQVFKLQAELARLSKNQEVELPVSSTNAASPKGFDQQRQGFPVLLGSRQHFAVDEPLDKEHRALPHIGQDSQQPQPAGVLAPKDALAPLHLRRVHVEALGVESTWMPINVVPPLIQDGQRPKEEKAPATPICIMPPPMLHEAPVQASSPKSQTCLAPEALDDQNEQQLDETRFFERRKSTVSCPPSCGSWEGAAWLQNPHDLRVRRASANLTSPPSAPSVGMSARMSRLSGFSKQPVKVCFSMWPVWTSVYTGELWSGESNASFLMNQRTWAQVMQKLNSFEGHHKCRSNRLVVRMLQLMVMHPSSLKRVIWTVLSMMFISYDLVVTPLTVFGLKESWLMDLMIWSSCIFWTLDFPMSMFVGFHEKGNLEMNVVKTIRKYATTWMAFDSCLIIVDWLVIVMGMWIDENSAAGARTLRMGKTLRTARTFRGLRLLRVLKMPKVIKETSYLVGRSEYTSLTLGILKHLFGILVINHFIACMWYFIGFPGGWVAYYAKDDSTPMVYFKSLHWSLTQFTPATMSVQPQTFSERVFAVAVLLFALITFSSFVSSITNLMTHLRNLRSAEIKQFMRVERYLHDHNISFHLSVRVRRYLEHLANEQQRNLQEKDVELLQKLSTPLHMELRYEVHFPTLSKHPVFLYQAMANLPVVQRVCLDTLKTVLLCAGDALFSTGDTARAMYFAQRGDLLYGKGGPKKTAFDDEKVSTGQWFSEVVLWTPWEHRGEMRAEIETSLLAIEATKFHDILKNNKTAAQQLVEYAAAVVERLNETDFGALTDLEHELYDSDILAKEAFNIEEGLMGSPTPSLRNLVKKIVVKKESWSQRSSQRSSYSGQKSGGSSRRSSQRSSNTASSGSRAGSQVSDAAVTHGP